MKYAILILTVLAITGCGQAPDVGSAKVSLPTIVVSTPETTADPEVAATPATIAAVTPVDPVAEPSPSPSASPLPPATVVSFIFQNSIGICDAVKNWSPQVTTIVFPANSGNSTQFVFAASGITIGNTDGSGGPAGKYTGTITKAGPLHDPHPTCVITVSLGQLVSVE